MHRHRREPRQDRFSVVYDDETAVLVVTVCDGVGQFDLSQEAAAFVVADAPRAYLRHRDWGLAVAEVNQRLFDFAERAPQRPRLRPLPADPRMATTFAGVAIRFEDTRRMASIAWTDDTSIWLLDQSGWTQLTGAGEDEGELHSSGVRAMPHRDLQLTVVEKEVVDGSLFVTTDGVGTPLANAWQVRETLAEWWATPPDVFTFARQVGFARKTHIDDRTAVGVWFDPT